MEKYNIVDAIHSLRPGAVWGIEGENYSSLRWEDTLQLKPTEDELIAEAARLNQADIDNAYKELRAKKYPSIEEQLDTLYHGGYDAWKASIKQIKDEYPKP